MCLSVCVWQLPHQDFWLELRSLVADGVAYAHARAASRGNYTKIEDASSAQDGGNADESDARKPAINAPGTDEPSVTSIANRAKSVGEVRDDTVHSSKQKITVVVAPQGQAQAEQSESEDEELVE